MDDLISRQDALNALEWTWAGKAAFDAIKNLPTAQQWISCSERLPDEEQDVLITDGALIWVCDLVNTDCGYKWEDDYGYWHSMDEWKAWMPLPEPYKEEGEKNDEID